MWQGTKKGSGSQTAPKHQENPNGFYSATTRNLLVYQLDLQQVHNKPGQSIPL